MMLRACITRALGTVDDLAVLEGVRSIRTRLFDHLKHRGMTSGHFWPATSEWSGCDRSFRSPGASRVSMCLAGSSPGKNNGLQWKGAYDARYTEDALTGSCASWIWARILGSSWNWRNRGLRRSRAEDRPAAFRDKIRSGFPTLGFLTGKHTVNDGRPITTQSVGSESFRRRSEWRF